MNAKLPSRRQRPARLGRALLTALALVLAPDIRPALAQTQVQAAMETTVFTVIVTRHGVRSFTNPGPPYIWTPWAPVEKDNDLTAHGYRLMKLMGQFYRGAQAGKGLPVNCATPTAYVYADTAQRTLGTAHALIEGLCDPSSPAALDVFHTTNPDGNDPMFDATQRLFQLHKVDGIESKAAVAAVAGNPPASIVLKHASDFVTFQKLLDSRCGPATCPPLASAPSTIDIAMLAGLTGPVATASTYAENIFLEFAQCRPEGEITGLGGEQLRATLDAGMRLHVVAYDVNARNSYNPLVRGGTLIAHIAAMLDHKAGRKGVLDTIGIPDLDGTTLVVFSGHDTELGSLGGILEAHWNPEGGIMRDDMPPGAALIFDLVKSPAGFGVRISLAAMAREAYRAEAPFTGPLKPVAFTGCPDGGCIMPLAQLEAVALTLQALGLVVAGWDASSVPLPQDPGSVTKLKDPTWTDAKCRGGP